jgi:hypothetical protein
MYQPYMMLLLTFRLFFEFTRFLLLFVLFYKELSIFFDKLLIIIKLKIKHIDTYNRLCEMEKLQLSILNKTDLLIIEHYYLFQKSYDWLF